MCEAWARRRVVLQVAWSGGSDGDVDVDEVDVDFDFGFDFDEDGCDLDVGDFGEDGGGSRASAS